ncbi:Flavin-dependent tryptophan halogenase PrnA [Paraglaciecola mesophila]|uniref:Flavin-dependent tryptophan halogenase PrnA n=1 Tax=Paraglaciecola mesophila TaxID=197222 RepID=A0A857JN15_9ALTE|nr:tryptophan halogenase family protein [Paraglaciecola mesophila]QHJ12391.1 Flavin-dependent tryptophan halogenase PrnA [Paraglaciecola mesophila]
MQQDAIKHIVIAGGGTAGWMTAAAFGKLFGKNIKVTLVESDAIPTVGVGEATIPTLHLFHDLLKIKEADFMAATNATFKLGIKFENWYEKQQAYIHSFGHFNHGCWAAGFQHFWLRGQKLGVASEIGDYCPEHLACRLGKFATAPKQERNHAFHLDAGLYATFLRHIAQRSGVNRVEGKIQQVDLNYDSGFIQSLTLADGQCISGDLFIDCTGFRGLLIEQALNTGYEDWSHWLPCDSAVAVQTELLETSAPYTRSIAHDAGWQWQIPLQNRMGNGMVFCSKYISDEDAKTHLLSKLQGQPLNTPRIIKFKTGVRRKLWNKNCVAIGLAGGFIEPLESTSIHLIQQSVIRLMQSLPSIHMESAIVDKFNATMRSEIDNIRDFIVLHYHATARRDSAFWRYCKDMPIPKTLQERMQQFAQSGHVHQGQGELFGEASWLQVMLGQGITPSTYHPIVDLMPAQELTDFLTSIKQQTARRVGSLPDHLAFIRHYCPSKAS